MTTRVRSPHTSVPLARTYDVGRLTEEVLALRRNPWRAQRAISQDGLFQEAEIDWRIIALRSLGGDPDRTDPGGAGLDAFADTVHLKRSPYLTEVLAGLPARLRGVRLMALGPGARIYEHRDGKVGLPWGNLRLHVPIVTNPGAIMVIGGDEVHWDAGRLWYGDFNQVHHVRNTGDESRIHLVIDCAVTAESLALFPVEFLDRLGRHDVILERPAVRLRAADLDAFRCTVAMPATFPDWSEDETDAALPDLPASIEARDGRLVLVTGSEPRFTLVHVGMGEFRLEGWTDERTLHVDLSPPSPRVRFRVREGHALTECVRPAMPVPA